MHVSLSTVAAAQSVAYTQTMYQQETCVAFKLKHIAYQLSSYLSHILADEHSFDDLDHVTFTPLPYCLHVRCMGCGAHLREPLVMPCLRLLCCSQNA